MHSSRSKHGAYHAPPRSGERRVHPLAHAARWVVMGASALAVLPALVAPISAHAEDTAESPVEKRFDIRPGPLSRAVNEFATAAGIQLSVDAALTANLSSPGVKGGYSVPAGFTALLAGTGLIAVHRGGGEYTLRKAPAQSQNTSGESGAAATLPTVTVAAKAVQPGELPEAYAGGQVARGGAVGVLGTQDIMDTPLSITSYTSELIENQQARSVTNVVANDPSVRSSVSSGSFYEGFTVRGFTLAPSEMSFLGLYGLMPITRTSVEFAERVDVIKGPAAMLTGMPPSGGIGGTVSITPKRAGDKPLTRLGVGFDSRNRPGTHADIGRRFGPDDAIGVRVNGVVRGGEGPVEGEDYRTQLGSLGLDYRGKQLRLAFDAYYQNERQDGGGYGLSGFKDPLVLPYKVPDPSKPMILGSRAHMRDKMAMISGEYDVAANTTLYGKYGWHDTEVLGVRAFLRDLDAAGNHSGAFTVQNTKARYRSGEIGARTELATGAVLHRLVASMTDYAHENFYAGFLPSAGDYVASNIYNPTPFLEPAQWPVDRRKNATTHLRSFALADTLSIWDERVLLTLGLRHQRVAVENFNTTTGATTTSYDESAVTPMVGLVIKPVQNISLYANYLEGLIRGPTAPSGTGLDNAGEVFAPYKSKQYEVGAKGEWDGFGASVSLFQISRPNTLTLDNRFSLDGEQRNRGMEFNVFGEPARGVRVLGGVVFMNAKIMKAAAAVEGNRAFGIPSRQANLGVEWDPSFAPGLTLNARVLHTGSVYLNNANTLSIPSWTRWDVGARYATRIAGKPVVFRANIENLTGKGYWMANDVEGWLSISAPRTFMLSATVDF